MEEQNKKLEAIMNMFNMLSYDEKKEKVIHIVEWLWEWEVYSRTLDIIKTFDPTEEYLNNIYNVIMEAKLAYYENWKEQDKLEAQKKMQEYMHKLNELSERQKEKDEQEAEEILNMI